MLESLKKEGVDLIFGLPGGAVLPIYDVLYDFEGIRHILVRQEAAAGHAAEGYSRTTGRVGLNEPCTALLLQSETVCEHKRGGGGAGPAPRANGDDHVPPSIDWPTKSN